MMDTLKGKTNNNGIVRTKIIIDNPTESTKKNNSIKNEGYLCIYFQIR